MTQQKQNRNLIYVDFCYPSTSRPLDTSKGPNDYAVSNYPDLDVFRQQLTLKGAGHIHHLYQIYKSRSLVYRCIFIAIGLVFASMASLVLAKTSAAPTHLLYEVFGSTLKYFLFGLCIIFSVVSSAFALSLRPETETLHELTRRCKRQLWQLYLTSRSEQKKLIYRDYKDQVDYRKETVQHLLSKISSSKETTQVERASLYEQALGEYHAGLEQLINEFRQK